MSLSEASDAAASGGGAAAMSDTERKLGQSLVDLRLLSVDDLERYAYDAGRSGQPLTRLLIETGRVSIADVLIAIAAQTGIPFCDVSNGFRPDPAVAQLIDEATARRLGALPYDIDPSGRVSVAVANPLDDAALASLRRAVGGEVAPALAERHQLEKAIAA
ncbi:MAG: hypothetical protein EHM57_06130, partial [Actinobacteria bacterium]